VLRVSAVVEQLGIPTSSLCCEGFLGQARTTAEGLGYSNIPIAMVPGHVDVQTAEKLRANIIGTTIEALIANLTESTPSIARSPDPGPRDIVFTGSFDEVNRFFIENGWSDGLPIVPPTFERVQAFLDFVDRDADEVLGVLLPDNRQATIWNVAVNGVIAGCRPEYMPILVALVEAMVDPRYGVEHSGNTPGAETQIIINGPLIRELGFNYEQGALRDGFQPNTSIGRFWRLYLRNVAGFLLHHNDKGTFGGTWHVVLAENEAVLARIGWPTVAQGMGMAPDANAVTISRFTGGNVIVSVFGDSATKALPYLADALVTHTTWEVIFVVGMATGTYQPLLVLSPLIAEMIAGSGLSKSDVQQWLYENARMRASRFENLMSNWTNLVPGRRTLFDLAKLGKAPKAFGESRDPDRLVPIVVKPQDIIIAVAGDPLRSNCYVMPHNGMLGYTTSKEIRLPRDWDQRLRDSG
jgi:hypothetical protein